MAVSWAGKRYFQAVKYVTLLRRARIDGQASCGRGDQREVAAIAFQGAM
jgi:hypothetical protein